MDLTGDSPCCTGSGHVAVSCQQENTGLAHGTVTITWCLVCGQRNPDGG